MNRKILALVLAVIVIDLAALDFFAFARAERSPISQAPQALPPAIGAPVSPAGGSAASLETTLERIYARVNPSIVAIRVVQKQSSPFSGIPEIPGFPFFGFPPGQQNQYVQAEGSGFVYDTAGDIVTNNHVINGATRIAVVFADGTTVAGRVVGADPSSDLAVVRVNPPSGVHPVQLADSSQVRVGQLAVAIGNPFGEQNTMTVGIVSAVGRALPSNDGSSGPSYTIPDVIQTDAPINPGNSGGVLLDDTGRVIGVTSAIESPVRASAGVGFAIPSAIVQQVVPSLIATGRYTHPYLGVSGLSLSPDLAKAMSLPDTQRGALVIAVAPGGPAQRAGLHGSMGQVTVNGQQVPVGGDIVVAIDGHPVKGFGDLVTYLARNTKVGQTVALTALRGGSQQTFKVTLAPRPSSPQP
jgi:serine protease Do